MLLEVLLEVLLEEEDWVFSWFGGHRFCSQECSCTHSQCWASIFWALSYLQDMAQEWFEPGISSLTDDYPERLDDWDLFVDELQNNFGPFDKSANVEHELTNLRMKDSQRISEYLICFNSLAVHCPWGESTLQYRFYKGLPAHLKDEICKGDGKPNMLSELQKNAKVTLLDPSLKLNKPWKYKRH